MSTVKKKVLILSYNFAPRHTVGAIRPTKLAQYLSELGCEVDVVTVAPYGEIDRSMDDVFGKIHKIDLIDRKVVDEKPAGAAKPSAPAAASVPAKSRKPSFVRTLKREVYDYKKIRNSKRYAAEFARLIKSDPDRFGSYDACISSYGPVASHLCGLVMKKLCPKVKWIADFRDPMVVNSPVHITRIWRAHMQKKVCKKADRLVAVSHGYHDRIFDRDEFRAKSSVIYNGFDRRDIDVGGVAGDGEFSFTYVGTIWEDNLRDVTPLFRALNSLIDDGTVSADDTCVKYVGSTFATLKKQAEACGYKGRLIDCGRVPRDKCLELQAASRYLIITTWNERSERGVFPGKFLEYIMIGRPIVSLVKGDEPNSEVTLVMKRARLGITYEETSADADFAAMRDALATDYKRFKAGLDADFAPDAEEVASFDFRVAAQKFLDLI